mgnify:CR=1 FL=1|jgi:chemotaxis protein MotB
MAKTQSLLEESEDAGWIITFADLMTLLLVFFVLLFSISSVEKERFEQVAASLQNSFGIPNESVSPVRLSPIIPVAPEPEIVPPSAERPSATPQPLDPLPLPDPDLQALSAMLATVFERQQIGDLAEIRVPLDDQLSIQVHGTALFDSGSSDLNYEVDQVLDALLQVFLLKSEYTINIQGHTDNLPITTARYESNWELSAIRATTVLRYFISRGVPPKRLTATGYGDSMPIASNETEKGRSANRRIEFVLEKK